MPAGIGHCVHDMLAGDHQCRRGDGIAADQRVAAAVHKFRRIKLARDVDVHGRAVEHCEAVTGYEHDGEGERKNGLQNVFGAPMTTAVLLQEKILHAPPACIAADSVRVAFASGGTGGHLYPGMAVARALMEQSPQSRCMFLISEKAVEARILAASEFAYSVLPAAQPQLRQTMTFLHKLFTGVVAARAIFRDFRPQALVALGGFASFAPAIAARSMGIPVFVAEQNRVAGRANLLLSFLSKGVFTAFPGMGSQFPLSKVFAMGNPVRRCALRAERSLSLDGLGLKSGKFTVLVLGGSQGAAFLNTTVTDSLERLADLRDQLQWIHLTGPQDAVRVKALYARQGWSAAALPFFERMGLCYGACDLVVSRSGASTVAEIIANGLASALIPYPHAIRDHQKRNAEILSEKGAALLLQQDQLTSSSFSTVIRSLMRDRERLGRMQIAAKKLYQGDAATSIALQVTKQIIRNGKTVA